jgi:hypothetical protein
MIVDIINILQSNNFYGAGNYVEIAKGKFEQVNNWKGFKRKVKRIWLSKK